MLNLFVEFGVQPFDMKTLPNFKLREGLSIINSFETGGITTVSAMPRTTEMSKNVGIFVPKKMLINTCVKMPISFTNITRKFHLL